MRRNVQGETRSDRCGDHCEHARSLVAAVLAISRRTLGRNNCARVVHGRALMGAAADAGASAAVQVWRACRLTVCGVATRVALCLAKFQCSGRAHRCKASTLRAM